MHLRVSARESSETPVFFMAAQWPVLCCLKETVHPKLKIQLAYFQADEGEVSSAKQCILLGNCSSWGLV